METRAVECLNCGATRLAACAPGTRLETGECVRCGYLGWAVATDLSEATRRFIRERPVAHRRLHAVGG